jgi:hypothetical protein
VASAFMTVEFASSLARIRTEVSPIMSRTLYPLSYQAAGAG